MRTRPILHLRGPVLVGDEDVAGELWVLDGRITFERPATSDQAQTISGWVLPGLVDAHCHIGLGSQGAVDEATAVDQATTERGAGALLLRDAGSPADTRWIDERDDLPKIIRAGRHIARPKRYIRHFAHEIEPDELVSYVVAQARLGDGWVKLVGDWIDRDLGDLAPCWPSGAAADAIAAAHAEGARVTAHCFAEDSVIELVAAGIDCIEHATGLTASTVDLLGGRGVPIVPTLVNTATFPRIADGAQEKFPHYADHMRALHARRYATVRMAYEAGIPVYAGTDAGGSLAHGLVAHEVAELVHAGLPAREAISAATWAAREWLGGTGIAEGAPADLIVVPDDPRENVAVLAHPNAVVLRGRAW